MLQILLIRPVLNVFLEINVCAKIDSWLLGSLFVFTFPTNFLLAFPSQLTDLNGVRTDTAERTVR